MSYLYFTLEFLAVSLLLLGAYRLRTVFGMSAAAAAVAAMQFIQAYTGGSVFWEVAGGFTVSPGSFILFTGNLALVLYAYANDGLQQARILLYAVIIGNATQSIFAILLSMHIAAVPPVGGAEVAEPIFSQSVSSTIVGLAVLYVDQLLMLLIYSWCSRRHEWLRGTLGFAFALAVTASFDTFAYVGVMFAQDPEVWSMIGGGVASKIIGALAFGLFWGPWINTDSTRHDISLGRVFGLLTFRERFSELEWAAKHDDLTGLYNRYTYERVAARILDESDPDEDSHGLLMCDLDRFKQVNDVLGHEAGDELLVEIGRALESTVRERDYVFRFGGDEFVVLLRDAGPEGMRRVTENLADLRFERDGLDEPVSLTVGAALYPDDGENASALYETADDRLYRGKSRGGGTAVGPASDD